MADSYDDGYTDAILVRFVIDLIFLLPWWISIPLSLAFCVWFSVYASHRPKPTPQSDTAACVSTVAAP